VLLFQQFYDQHEFMWSLERDGVPCLLLGAEEPNRNR